MTSLHYGFAGFATYDTYDGAYASALPRSCAGLGTVIAMVPAITKMLHFTGYSAECAPHAARALFSSSICISRHDFRRARPHNKASCLFLPSSASCFLYFLSRRRKKHSCSPLTASPPTAMYLSSPSPLTITARRCIICISPTSRTPRRRKMMALMAARVRCATK